MPQHGEPHGFTMAQMDPHPPDDAMWSYLDAIRAGAGVLFDKADRAKDLLEKHATKVNAAYQAKVAAGAVGLENPNAVLDLTIPKHREVLLRTAVKLYNGGTEFIWGHPHGFVPPAAGAPAVPMDWVVQPSVKSNYPDLALGTHVGSPAGPNPPDAKYNKPEPIEFESTEFVLP